MSKLREYKGDNIIALPVDYVVIDTETTGLDYDYCDLIEVAAIRVRNGEIVDSFSSLVQPPISAGLIHLDDFEKIRSGEMEEPYEYVDEFITDLTGITNEMLAEAPGPETVLPHFSEFIGSDIMLGHNIHFDVNFLYDAYEKYLDQPLKNNFIDNLRIARKLLPNQNHHRLRDVVETLGVSSDSMHRAETDCVLTYNCYIKLREMALEQGSEEEFIHTFDKKSYTHRAKDINASVSEFDEEHPLFGKTIVFTGALSNMTRNEAMQRVADVGGYNADTVTKKTNYLVVGTTDFAKSVKEGKTNKMRKAEAASIKGQDIVVISEGAFFQLLNNQ